VIRQITLLTFCKCQGWGRENNLCVSLFYMPGYGTRTEEVVWYCHFHSGGNVLSPREVRKHLFLEHVIKKLIFFCFWFSYFINAVYASCFREDEMQELNRTTNSRMGWLSFLSLFVCLSVAGLQLWHLKTFFEKKKLI